MRSYDYCHFEASIQLAGDNVTLVEIDNARKDCQRLADKAVGQYKTAKEMEIKRTGSAYGRSNLKFEVDNLKRLKPEYLTPEEQARIKAYDDYVHQTRYDYDDDYNYDFLNND